jgi:predicted ABC-type ATPase
MDTPLVVVVAGPNGAGKSTTAPRLLRGALTVTELVNADAIAQGLSAFRPETVASAAGRVMLHRLRALVSARESFAFARSEPLWTQITERFNAALPYRLYCAETG